MFHYDSVLKWTLLSKAKEVKKKCFVSMS
jgi:hypothetical protein